MADPEAASPRAQVSAYTDRTAWARNLAAPVRDFLSTETGSASVLVAAIVVALLRIGVDDEALDSAGWRLDLDQPPPLGQRRPDDVLLPGGGPGGQARA